MPISIISSAPAAAATNMPRSVVPTVMLPATLDGASVSFTYVVGAGWGARLP